MSKRKTATAAPAPWEPKYKARKGGRLTDEDANNVGLEVKLMEEGGVLVTAENILSRAKKKRHPLHNLFTWDDTSAANQYRLAQARHMLRSYVQIDITTGRPGRGSYNIIEGEVEEVDVSDNPIPKRSIYMSREKVIKNTDAIEQVSERLYKTVLAAINEAESLGLTANDDGWKRLANAVRRHLPRIIRLKAG